MPDKTSHYVVPEIVAAVEIGMLEDAFGAAPEDVRQRFGYDRRRLGDALLACCSSIPDNPMLNRLVGLTSSQPRWRQHLGEAIAEFARRGVSGVIEAVAGDMPLLEELSMLGCQPTSECAFALIRSCRPDWPVDAAMPVRELVAEQAGQFACLVSAVFHMPAEFVDHYALFVGRPGWTMLGAFDGTELVATGGLHSQGEGAYLCFGATRSSPGASACRRLSSRNGSRKRGDKARRS